MYAAVKLRICLYIVTVLSEFSARSRSWRSALGALPGLPQAASPAGVHRRLRSSTLRVPSNVAQDNGLSEAVQMTLQMRYLNLSTCWCQCTASGGLPNSARAVKWCLVQQATQKSGGYEETNTFS